MNDTARTFKKFQHPHHDFKITLIEDDDAGAFLLADRITRSGLVCRKVGAWYAATAEQLFGTFDAVWQFPLSYQPNWESLATHFGTLDTRKFGDGIVLLVAEVNHIFYKESPPERQANLSRFIDVLQLAWKNYLEPRDNAGFPFPFHVVFHASSEHIEAVKAMIEDLDIPYEQPASTFDVDFWNNHH